MTGKLKKKCLTTRIIQNQDKIIISRPFDFERALSQHYQIIKFESQLFHFILSLSANRKVSYFSDGSEFEIVLNESYKILLLTELLIFNLYI